MRFQLKHGAIQDRIRPGQNGRHDGHWLARTQPLTLQVDGHMAHSGAVHKLR